MNRKRLLIVVLPFLCLMLAPSIARAAEITLCTFNKGVYFPSETGYITVTIFNGENDKIQVTALSAAIDYYYTDENIYVQTFYSDEALPIEIERGESDTFNIPFSLPTNIAPGYTTLYVKAITELWRNESEMWVWSEHPTYHPILYIESPYKSQFEEEQMNNHRLEEQLLEMQAINDTTTIMMYLFSGTTMVLGVIMLIIVLLGRKARPIPQTG